MTGGLKPTLQTGIYAGRRLMARCTSDGDVGLPGGIITLHDGDWESVSLGQANKLFCFTVQQTTPTLSNSE